MPFGVSVIGKDKGIRMEKVLYEELCPDELVQRLQEMPVAYLPLGTLEWHGPHMPLGADGIQSKELFVRVAEKSVAWYFRCCLWGRIVCFMMAKNHFMEWILIRKVH